MVRENEDLMTANFFRFSSQFVEEFRRYSTFFADFLSIGGFEYCARIGRLVNSFLCFSFTLAFMIFVSKA